MPQRENPSIDQPEGLDRRTFCIGAAATGLAVACGGGGGGSTTPPPPPPPSPLVTTTDTKAAMLALPDGTTRDYRNQGIFLIKDATGIYAMTVVCTHMGCTVGLPSGSQITCPCHGSQFSLGGSNLTGPATTPLAHFLVTEPTPGAFLVVDKSQTVASSVRLA